MKKPAGQRWLLLATSAAYLLIGLEVLFMITPFALYFYGVYGPLLEFLGAHRTTAWTTEFFLPHLVFVDDPLLIFLSYLQILFIAGLALFLLAAVPLYYGRWTGKGVVRFGFYGRLRHPQYLFLAISGLGLLLYWPRFIVLIFYVSMLFVYYLLARNEEWRMQREQPEAYAAYLKNTWMFLPGEPGAWLYRNLFGWLGPRWLGLSVLFPVALAGALLLAGLLRVYTLQQLPQTQEAGMTLISVYPRDLDEVARLYVEVAAHSEVSAALAEGDLRLAYAMPGDFFLTGLILAEGPRFSEAQLKRYPALRQEGRDRGDWLQKFFRLGYKFFRTIGTSRRVYDVERFVFVAAREPEGAPAPAGRLFAAGVSRTPQLVVDVDFETHEIIQVTRASGDNRWGRLPMPVF